MPELPEVETVVSELKTKLKGKNIRQVEVRLSKIVSIGPKTLSNVRINDPAVVRKFTATLRGQKITDVQRRAKLIIIDLAGKYALLVHLKMTGQLIYFAKKDLAKKIRLLNIENAERQSLPAKWTHVIFEFTDGSKLFFNDLRQFGYLKLVADKEIGEVQDLREFGPEPLDIAFTLSVFKKLLAKSPKAKLKQFLMDPKKIAGIGNIYSDEIAFFARVRPTRMLKNLSDKEQAALYRGIRTILKDAIYHAGSSVGDFIRPSGEWGKYGSLHKVYGRSGLKCKTCGTVIKSIKLNGRTGSFCPNCQK
jgi:formamidopyrimidine-DNA glycosylase